jgi:hypothetical protein
VGFSPDGRWLLTSGGRARIWRVGSWEKGPDVGDSGRRSFAFSPNGAIHIFDLRALRAELAELDLDWDAPPLPRPAALADLEPLDVRLDMGDGAGPR